MLDDLLSLNPYKRVLSSKLNLVTSEISKSKTNDSQTSNNSIKKSYSSQNSYTEMDKNKNNKVFYKLSLGENLEFNSLLFLRHGIKAYTNLPRIIFYPLVDYKDYKEIDSSFLVKEMKTDLNLLFKL